MMIDWFRCRKECINKTSEKNVIIKKKPMASMMNEMVHYMNYSPIIIVDSPLTSSLCLIIAHRLFFSRRGILPMNTIHMYQSMCLDWNRMKLDIYHQLFFFIYIVFFILRSQMIELIYKDQGQNSSMLGGAP